MSVLFVLRGLCAVVAEGCKALAEYGMWLAISELRSARGGAVAM